MVGFAAAAVAAVTVAAPARAQTSWNASSDFIWLPRRQVNLEAAWKPDRESLCTDARKMPLQRGWHPFRVPLFGCRKTRHQAHQPPISSKMPLDMVAEVPLAGTSFVKIRRRPPTFHKPWFLAYNRGFMIPRGDKIERLHSLLKTHPVVALLGPRQSGKTTLARGYMAAHGLGDAASPNYFDLEDPAALARLETPKLALESLTGLVVIDEVQRVPDLFPLLRVLVDRDDSPCRFLVLGSASRDLIRQSSESLAGRIAYLDVPPLDLAEVGADDAARLWLRGGFPRSFLAPTEPASVEWRRQFITTFLERDIPALGLTVPPQQLRRFWMMLTHFHGQTFNASEIGRSLQVSDTTVARYLDILAGTFMVRTLRPWFENIGKRQVKRPKIFIRDSGLLHALMGITSRDDLLVHARLGASWEGFALEQVMTVLNLDTEAVHCWGVHQQCDLDLFVIHHGRRIGFEIKYTEAPAVSGSMRAACEALALERLVVVCPGRMMHPLSDRIEVCGIERLGELRP